MELVFAFGLEFVVGLLGFLKGKLGEWVFSFGDLLLDDSILHCKLEYACLVVLDMWEEEGLCMLKVLNLVFELKNMGLVFDHMILVLD